MSAFIADPIAAPFHGADAAVRPRYRDCIEVMSYGPESEIETLLRIIMNILRPITPVSMAKGVDMKVRTLLLASLAAACLWPAVHADAEDNAQLAQIKARISESRQNSSGPLAEFAGVYDILKSCRPPPQHADAPLGVQWLITKSVFWFEGDDIVFFKFITPANAERGTLKFKQDYAIASDHTIKLYDVIWQAGNRDIMAFLPDRDLFDGKFVGRKFSFNYALRCGNEDQILSTTEKILRQINP